jgi:hypothetical protein
MSAGLGALCDRLRRQGAAGIPFPRCQAGASAFSPPGPASTSFAADFFPAVRGMIEYRGAILRNQHVGNPGAGGLMCPE